MATPNRNSLNTKLARAGIPLVRPLWIFLTAFTLILVKVALQVGIPIYRRHVLIEEKDCNVAVKECSSRGPL